MLKLNKRSFLSTAALALSLAACGDNKDNGTAPAAPGGAAAKPQVQGAQGVKLAGLDAARVEIKLLKNLDLSNAQFVQAGAAVDPQSADHKPNKDQSYCRLSKGQRAANALTAQQAFQAKESPVEKDEFLNLNLDKAPENQSQEQLQAGGFEKVKSLTITAKQNKVILECRKKDNVSYTDQEVNAVLRTVAQINIKDAAPAQQQLPPGLQGADDAAHQAKEEAKKAGEKTAEATNKAVEAAKPEAQKAKEEVKEAAKSTGEAAKAAKDSLKKPEPQQPSPQPAAPAAATPAPAPAQPQPQKP